MSRLKQFKLPDLGEGLTEGEILKWLVHPGDTVTLNQPIVEVETAKAAVEVPSPYAGVVTQLHHTEGEAVDVGVPIITFDTDPTAGPLPGGDDMTEGVAARAARTAEAAGSRAEVVEDTLPAAVADAVDTAIEMPDADQAVEPGLIGG